MLDTLLAVSNEHNAALTTARSLKRETQKRWYWNNIEHVREKGRRWARQWRIKNPELAKLQDRITYARRTKISKYRKPTDASRKAHRKSEAKRKAIRLGCVLSDLKRVDVIYERCARLRRWFNVVVDHIIPLSKGGTHSSDNLQIIYHSENARKYNFLNYVPRIVFT